VRVPYIREGSTSDQSADMHIREIQEYCERPGWELIRDRSMTLPDRFAPSTSHLLTALLNFRSLGFEFVFLSENVDTSTSTGKHVFRCSA
jgi:DNA invertase Pin-like site-specific DNA recombinase